MTAVPAIPANLLSRADAPRQIAAEPAKPARVALVTKIEEKAPRVRRVTDADLPALVPWLIARFKEKYPGVSEIGVVNVLKAAMAGGKQALLRTEHCIGFYEARPSSLNAAPVIWEVWTRSCDPGKHKDELRAIVAEAFAWATRIGGCELNYGLDSDLPINDCYDAIPIKGNLRKTYHKVGVTREIEAQPR